MAGGACDSAAPLHAAHSAAPPHLDVHKVARGGRTKRAPLQDVAALLELAQHQRQVVGREPKHSHPGVIQLCVARGASGMWGKAPVGGRLQGTACARATGQQADGCLGLPPPPLEHTHAGRRSPPQGSTRMSPPGRLPAAAAPIAPGGVASPASAAAAAQASWCVGTGTAQAGVQSSAFQGGAGCPAAHCISGRRDQSAQQGQTSTSMRSTAGAELMPAVTPVMTASSNRNMGGGRGLICCCEWMLAAGVRLRRDDRLCSRPPGVLCGSRGVCTGAGALCVALHVSVPSQGVPQTAGSRGGGPLSRVKSSVPPSDQAHLVAWAGRVLVQLRCEREQGGQEPPLLARGHHMAM